MLRPQSTACSSFLLPKLLGHSRALSLFLTGQTVTPDSPLISGLYHSILPTREEVFPAALALAKDLAANTSQTAAAVTKALVWHGYDTMEEQHIVDSRAIRVLGLSADAAEGALAFKERRAPKFADTLANLAPWMPWVSQAAAERDLQDAPSDTYSRSAVEGGQCRAQEEQAVMLPCSSWWTHRCHECLCTRGSPISVRNETALAKIFTV